MGRHVYRIFILSVCVSLFSSRCKSPEEPEKPQPGQVTLRFAVYNHTQGSRGSFTKIAMSGDSVSIKVKELKIDDVDQQRIAIREDGFSNLVTFSNTGEANFRAPNQNMNYDIILFNSSNNAPYQWLDDQNSKLYLDKRDYVVFRKDRDGVTGQESLWERVFGQLNSALDLGWVKWGSINREPSATSGDFSYGYGICIAGGTRGDGLHEGSFIFIDPEINRYNPISMTSVGLSVAFENICSINDVIGLPSLMTIQKYGVLLPEGKDLFAYVYAKDGAGKTSGSSSRFRIGFIR
jgi:hypothetical protein